MENDTHPPEKNPTLGGRLTEKKILRTNAVQETTKVVTQIEEKTYWYWLSFSVSLVEAGEIDKGMKALHGGFASFELNELQSRLRYAQQAAEVL
eukprot:2323194-Amphidinium_carterae.1